MILIIEQDLSWLKEYLKEGVYQEGSMVELLSPFSPYELLNLEKKEEIETRYGNIQIAYFEGKVNGEDKRLERKEVALFSLKNRDGLVICNYRTSAIEYEGILAEVLPGLFEPKQ